MTTSAAADITARSTSGVGESDNPDESPVLVFAS
jgi:hypothetical protein